MRIAVLIVASTLSISPALAIDCSPIKPEPPKNTDVTFSGKVEASIDGLFKKLASAGAKVDGTYHEVSTTVLKEFPNADRLYMWERVLYLQCGVLNDAKDIEGKEKVKLVGELYSKFGSPPPINTGIINSGHNNVITQGHDNTTTVGK